jgi:hypothetical protein
LFTIEQSYLTILLRDFEALEEQSRVICCSKMGKCQKIVKKHLINVCIVVFGNGYLITSSSKQLIVNRFIRSLSLGMNLFGNFLP